MHVLLIAVTVSAPDDRRKAV